LVPAIDNVCFFVRTNCNSIWPTNFKAMPLSNKTTLTVEYLYAGIAAICNVNSTVAVDCYSMWQVKLALLRPFATPLKLKLPFRREFNNTSVRITVADKESAVASSVSACFCVYRTASKISAAFPTAPRILDSSVVNR